MFEDAECEVCYADHNDENHEATLRVHRWFHYQVTRRLDDEVEEEGMLTSTVTA